MEYTDPKLEPVYQQLQKSFRILNQCNTTWIETLQQCQGEIDSLQNLTEQYRCCELADTSSLVVMLPDITDKLLYKISTEIDKKINKLYNLINSLKDIHDRISKQYGYSLEVSKNLPWDVVTMATETIPPVSDMVEWLNDVEILLHHQYCAKKYLLDMFDVQKFESEKFVEKWKSGNTKATQKINDVLCYVQFLIEET